MVVALPCGGHAVYGRWVLWIIYQINPQPLITNAGFEAAAKATRLAGCQGRDHAGRTARCAGRRPPAGDSSTQAASAQAEAAKPPVQTPAEPKEPPVNVEKLKFADSIETPIPERGKKK